MKQRKKPVENERKIAYTLQKKKIQMSNQHMTRCSPPPDTGGMLI